ncbi:hypothetical protein HDU76_002096, partial [Blyttiomyces sp. JEL0837]
WWNWSPDGHCGLKQTNKTDTNPYYTWFVNATGAIRGNLPAGKPVFPGISADSPFQCHQMCQNFNGCQWASYQFSSFNQHVHCYLKQATSLPGTGKVTGYSMKPNVTAQVPGYNSMGGFDIGTSPYATTSLGTPPQTSALSNKQPKTNLVTPGSLTPTGPSSATLPTGISPVPDALPPQNHTSVFKPV